MRQGAVDSPQVSFEHLHYSVLDLRGVQRLQQTEFRLQYGVGVFLHKFNFLGRQFFLELKFEGGAVRNCGQPVQRGLTRNSRLLGFNLLGALDGFRLQLLTLQPATSSIGTPGIDQQVFVPFAGLAAFGLSL